MKHKNIPKGYKDSPLGIIPKEWDIKKIKHFGKVITGNTPSTADINNYGDEYMFVSPADLSASKYITNTERKLSLKGFSASRIMPKGTVLFTCIGSTIGKSGIATKELTSNQQINAIICNSSSNNEFLYYELCFRASKIKLIAGEQAVPIINKSDFENIKIVFPPIKEQKRIAELLSVWDEAIDKQTKLIDVLICRNHALMQQLLTGKKRLEAFNYKWKKVTISNFTKEINIRNKSNSKLKVLSCTKYDGLVPSLEYFGRQVFSNNLNQYKVVPKYCFAYATNHIEEGSIGYQDLYNKALISPMYTVFKTDNCKINDIFLYKLLKSPQLIYIYSSMMEGSINRRGGLRWNSFSSIKLSTPSIQEQEAIAKVIIIAENTINSAKQKLKLLYLQKKGLMQQLLTGKIRMKI